MSKENRDGNGFSLVELLVVIVILGILSAAAMFAVRAITDRGETNSCATDLRTVEEAEDIHYAMHGEYASEITLVGTGLLRSVSTLHDITATADSYSVTGVGTCAAGASAAPSGSTSTRWAGLPAYRIGTGASVILLASVADGNVGATAMWSVFESSQTPADLSIYFVDTSSLGDTPSAAQLLTLLEPAPDGVVWVTSSALVPDLQGGPSTPVDTFITNAYPGQVCVIAQLSDLNNCGTSVTPIA